MQYHRTRWHHSNPSDPVILHAETDDNGNELRKVEEYDDGLLLFADRRRYSHDIELAYEPYPPVEAYANNPEFTVEPADEASFSAVWDRAQRHGSFVRLRDTRAQTVIDLVRSDKPGQAITNGIAATKHCLLELQPAARVDFFGDRFRIWSYGHPEVAPGLLAIIEEHTSAKFRVETLIK